MPCDHSHANDTPIAAATAPEQLDSRPVNPAQPLTPDLDTLVGLFFDRPERLGTFAEVSSDEMPPVYRTLLDHEHHMTVTVELHHGCHVEVRVLDVRQTLTHYARKILLVRETDQRVVQFGIMRIRLECLSPAVRAAVESQQTPLGRILVQHNVLRAVRLSSLVRVTPGEELCRHFGMQATEVTYGRTAMIDVDGEPAIELLEIVAPDYSPLRSQ
jgi:chorismate-pyruvate lyase